jgi:hypothetical protein
MKSTQASKPVLPRLKQEAPSASDRAASQQIVRIARSVWHRPPGLCHTEVCRTAINFSRGLRRQRALVLQASEPVLFL